MKAVGIALVLVALAVGVSWRRGLRLERELLVATVRAIVQLAILAAVIDLVFGRVGLAALVLVAMLAAASWTSGRRMSGIPGAMLIALEAIGISAGVAIAVMFGIGAFELEPRFLIPLAGIAIGNCMTATSLAGARLRDELVDKTQEVEARLALGVPVNVALAPYVRRAATTGLIPMIDATKNVGLIVLPGAFVGMILGGASPRAAAEVQLVVLFMLLGAVSLAGMIATLLVGRAFVAPGERLLLPEGLRQELARRSER